MSADPNTLMNDAKAIAQIPAGMQWPVLITIFANLASMSTDPNTLMDGARVINSAIPAGMQLPVLISLATQISGGGGGSASAYYTTPGPPVGTPAANSLLNIVVDSDGRQWQYYGGAWH